MAFRRMARRFRRRRRRLPETFTFVECFRCLNVAASGNCIDPFLDVTPLMMMAQRKAAGDPTELVSPERKGLVVDAIKFQCEYSSDPCAWDQCNSGSSPDIHQLDFIQRIWEAIVVLPLAVGTTATPAYLPKISSALEQSFDMADRVLWKRISHLPMFGPRATPGSFCQQETTIRDVGHGPVVVKSKVNLDDRHGLFFVRAFINDVVWPAGQLISCNLDCDNLPDGKLVPVVSDSWFKIFYHGTQKQA